MDLTGEPGDLLYVGFNQDSSCFACGTLTGFKIFHCDPFKETFKRDFAKGGIAHVEMLFRCNILALVGGGRSPEFPPNKVMIWDDHLNKCIGELSFRSEVQSVKLRRDRIVVVLSERVYVYNFADLRLVDHIETAPNPSGIAALCPNSASNVLAVPARQKGMVRVELYDAKATTIIPAHSGLIACLALNHDGSLLASASEKGTLVRVYDTASGKRLHEFRRGSSEAIIYSLSFSPGSEFLAVSSNKGTIHVFSLKHKNLPPPESEITEEKTTQISGLFGMANRFVPSYFTSEWSFAQFKVPDDVKTLVAFGNEKNSLIVVCADGSFYRATFDPAVGGLCEKESFNYFIKHPDSDIY